MSTQEERWEENSGYSPSTIAAEISAGLQTVSGRSLRRRPISKSGDFPELFDNS